MGFHVMQTTVGKKKINEGHDFIQQKAKDQREVRRMCMTAAHKYIIKLVANHIGLDQGAVEEFILDSERVSKQLLALKHLMLL